MAYPDRWPKAFAADLRKGDPLAWGIVVFGATGVAILLYRVYVLIDMVIK